ncbi:hypothetical protein SAMN00768000_3653 [Sulfobacillus thermosulfidooxidans DSM 9293]|uniref:Uncharacterized protein n=2 Tax=Sulfobacillus thermosulfidooxidans TaxID=28034 RepID=A0A1W1WPG2_SULTA|nr:hypothetical protein [Sulfobacillus thermosulfidooxidans]PSR21935.1 MAG: hypothetical protein C7B47_17020 [Sulfobacillus thermosulfidooxidans]SMC08102.1 hypothetical protein SAMN00768000_3653 [Sulfobacillus thermosulfidooxidans DSM 9293]
MKVSDHLRHGDRLPRGSWQGIVPVTRSVPPQKGRHAPYRRQPRRRADARIPADRSCCSDKEE